MPTDVPNTLGSLPRDASTSSAEAPVAALSSQPDDVGGDIDLAALERDAARDATADRTAATRPRKQQKSDTSREEEWMARMMEYMDTNNKLLERIAEDKQPETPKSAFIEYLSKWLRAAPDHQFQELRTIILERIHFYSRTSSAPPAPSLPPTTPQPQQQYFPFPGVQWPPTTYQLPVPHQPKISTPVRQSSAELFTSSFLHDLSFGAPSAPTATKVAPELATPGSSSAPTATQQVAPELSTPGSSGQERPPPEPGARPDV